MFFQIWNKVLLKATKLLETTKKSRISDYFWWLQQLTFNSLETMLFFEQKFLERWLQLARRFFEHIALNVRKRYKNTAKRINVYITSWKSHREYKHCFNVLNLENNFVKDIDWQIVNEWRSLVGQQDNFLSDNIINDTILEAKIYEIEKWKNNVFVLVQYVR